MVCACHIWLEADAESPPHATVAFLIAQQRKQIVPEQLFNRCQSKGVERGIQPFTEPLSVLCADCCQQLCQHQKCHLCFGCHGLLDSTTESVPRYGQAIKNPAKRAGLSVNQARRSCSAVQGEVPLFFVPSGQVVLLHITSCKLASEKFDCHRLADVKFAPERSASLNNTPRRVE